MYIIFSPTLVPSGSSLSIRLVAGDAAPYSVENEIRERKSNNRLLNLRSTENNHVVSLLVFSNSHEQRSKGQASKGELFH